MTGPIAIGNEATLAALETRAKRVGDCLEWTGSRTPHGYGRIQLDGRSQKVHRVAWIARHGQPPADTPYVLHRCDNPPCFADEHLFLGTQADNMRDRNAKGRNPHSRKTHCPAGHEYNTANTYRRASGRRRCRTCDREAHRP